MRKNALVVGGAGFLGSHLCERLLEKGMEVTCLDNFYTGRQDNVAHLLCHPSFELIVHDITHPFDGSFEIIYNFACPASPVHYQKDPLFTLKTSVWGAHHLLELARKCGCPIFQASTSEVYGDPHLHPQEESYWGNVNPIGARACYDEGKRCAETLFFDFHRIHKVPIKVGRIFNTFGPRMDPSDGRVVSNLIVQALRQEPLTLYGEGSQTRSFCYVDDLIEAILRFAETSEEEIGPLNLGNPSEYTVLQLAQTILEMTGSSSPISFSPLPSDDPKQRRPDITRATSLLGWTPTTSLREGLKKTIDYFETLFALSGSL